MDEGRKFDCETGVMQTRSQVSRVLHSPCSSRRPWNAPALRAVFHRAFVLTAKPQQLRGDCPAASSDGSDESRTLGERSPVRNMKAVEAVPPFTRCAPRVLTKWAATPSRLRRCRPRAHHCIVHLTCHRFHVLSCGCLLVPPAALGLRTWPKEHEATGRQQDGETERRGRKGQERKGRSTASRQTQTDGGETNKAAARVHVLLPLLSPLAGCRLVPLALSVSGCCKGGNPSRAERRQRGREAKGREGNAGTGRGMQHASNERWTDTSLMRWMASLPCLSSPLSLSVCLCCFHPLQAPKKDVVAVTSQRCPRLCCPTIVMRTTR
jgi:hypothetical protein